MRMNLSSAYDVRAENAVHVNLSMFRLNFPNVNFSTEEWCYANDVMQLWDHSSFVLKQALD